MPVLPTPRDKLLSGPVAQLDRAFAFEAKGWGFEPLRAHQLVVSFTRKSRFKRTDLKTRRYNGCDNFPPDLDSYQMCRKWRALLILPRLRSARKTPNKLRMPRQNEISTNESSLLCTTINP
jgi:hypothetical protein